MKMKVLSLVLAIIVPLVLLAAGVSVPQSANSPIAYQATQCEKGCFVNAIGYKDALEVFARVNNKNLNAKLLHVNVVTTEAHALCVFKYEGVWHAYDSLSGTYDLGKFDHEPTAQELATKISANYKDAHYYDK